MKSANKGYALLIVLLSIIIASNVHAQESIQTKKEDCNKLIWSNLASSSITKLEKESDAVSTIVESKVKEPSMIALRESTQEIYFFDKGDSKIKKTDLDGLNVEEVVKSGLSNVGGIIIDDAAGKMYWSDWGNKTIKSANADGTNVIVLKTEMTGVKNPGGMDIDFVNKRLYWADAGLRSIKSSDFDGTNELTVVSNLAYPRGVALDPVNHEIYWSDAGINEIKKSSMEGANIQSVASTGLLTPLSISINSRAEKLYCTDWGSYKVLAMNYDGSQLNSLATSDVSLPNSIVYNETENRIYWVDWASDKIVGADVNGDNVADVITSLTAEGLAINESTNEFYWSDVSSNRILKSDSDGGNMVVIADDLANPRGIAIHQNSQKLFWVESASKKIFRSNMDGTDKVVIVSWQLKSPFALAIDQDQNKIYWTDIGTKTIMRANLDGSGKEIIISDLISPEGLVIDHIRKKLYWTDLGANSIQQANLDGTGIVDFVTDDVNSAIGIAIDEFYGFLYWTNSDDNEVKKLNLRNMSVETVYSDFHNDRPAAMAMSNSRCYDVGMGTVERCTALEGVFIGDTNNTEWLPIKDSDGTILALVNGNGNTLGAVSAQVYIDNEAVRYQEENPYARRDIQIRVENQPTTTAYVRLFFTISEINDLEASIEAIGGDETISIRKLEDNCSGVYAGDGIELNKDLVAIYGDNYFVDVEVSSFSTFYAAGSAAGALAVNFGYFKGAIEKQGIALNWKTESEINSDYFEVMRQNEAGDFDVIANVKAEGESYKYNAFDRNPNNGLNYYKIKEFDYDGGVTISKTISIKWIKRNVISSYPNPALNELTIEVSTTDNDYIRKEVVISDMTGREVLRENFIGTKTKLNLLGISSGVYFLKVNNYSGNLLTDKLIIQN